MVSKGFWEKIMNDKNSWWKRFVQWPIFFLGFFFLSIFMLFVALFIFLVGTLWPIAGSLLYDEKGRDGIGEVKL